MNKKGLFFIGLIMALLLLSPCAIFAKTAKAKHIYPIKGLTMEGNRLAAIGTVASLEGTTINLLGDNGVKYVINASSSKIIGGNEKIAITDIATGDKLTVYGDLSNNNISAFKIVDNSKVAVKNSSSVKKHVAKNKKIVKKTKKIRKVKKTAAK